MAFAKEKERSVQKGDKRVKVISRAMETGNIILPTLIVFQGKDEAKNLCMALDSFDIHFESLLKTTEDKADKSFLEKKLKEVCQSISWDLDILKTTTLKAKRCVSQGRKIYNYYINPCRHVKNIEDIIAKDRATLDSLMESCETSSQTVLEMDK